VDDFAIATKDEETAQFIITQINDKLHLPIHIMGIIKHFNGIDVEQTKHYVKIHCQKYIDKLIKSHEGLLSVPTSAPHAILPFPSDKTTLSNIIHGPVPESEQEQLTLEKKMGFKYRHVMGEVLYPMVKCRPDISAHAIILGQYMNNPGEIHYVALKHILTYLAATASEGIHYWRTNPHPTLSDMPLPETRPDNHIPKETRHINTTNPIALVDSNWATNTKKRTSMTGMMLTYAGGAVGYKSKFQTLIAHSSTEAEFVAACDTAKMILFFRSLLHDINIEQQEATVLFEDNHGALMMANAQQPTRRMCHMDIKHFALLDWVEMDLLTLEAIHTSDNAADAMTKPLTKQTFTRHFDTYMGKMIPEYGKRSNKQDVQKVHTSHYHFNPSNACVREDYTVRTKHGGGGYWTYI
jgi:hypothetical protein